MKCAIYHEFGEADVVKYEDIAEPEIESNEVLVRVKSASLNQLDIRLRSGKSPRPVDLPHVGGVDAAGIVEEVGDAVVGIEKGMRVVIWHTVQTVSYKTGRPAMALNKVLGVNLYGSFAEFVKVPAENIVELPDEVGFDDASVLPICYVTAWYGLIARGGIKAGETVLVHAAGSGTGSAAVEVAKLCGAHVIATAGSDEKLEKAKQLGADEVINYNTSDFAEEVKKVTAKAGVDLIFDQIGASAWDGNMKSLSPNGRLLLVGVVGGVSTTAALGPIIVRDVSVLGVTVFNATRGDLADVVRLVAKGDLKPVIHSTMPLSEAQAAQQILEDRAQFGKVILNP